MRSAVSSCLFTNGMPKQRNKSCKRMRQRFPMNKRATKRNWTQRRSTAHHVNPLTYTANDWSADSSSSRSCFSAFRFHSFRERRFAKLVGIAGPISEKPKQNCRAKSAGEQTNPRESCTLSPMVLGDPQCRVWTDTVFRPTFPKENHRGHRVHREHPGVLDVTYLCVLWDICGFTAARLLW
jgi:hypothetical protein